MLPGVLTADPHQDRIGLIFQGYEDLLSDEAGHLPHCRNSMDNIGRHPLMILLARPHDEETLAVRRHLEAAGHVTVCASSPRTLRDAFDSATIDAAVIDHPYADAVAQAVRSVAPAVTIVLVGDSESSVGGGKVRRLKGPLDGPRLVAELRRAQ